MTAGIWAPKPRKSDFDAAENYLSLVFPPGEAAKIRKDLQRTPTREYEAKDVLRASRSAPMPSSETRVAANLQSVIQRRKITPVLLVRDPDNGVVIIADGFHRLSAAYILDEKCMVSCIIVDRPQGE